MDEIERIVSLYHGNGTWRGYSNILDAIAYEMVHMHLSQADVIDAIYRGLLNSQYLQGQNVRNT